MKDPYAPLGEYDPELFVQDTSQTDNDCIPFAELVITEEIDLLYGDISGIIYGYCRVKPKFINHALYPLFLSNGDVAGGEVRVDYSEGDAVKKYVRPIAFSASKGLVLRGAPGTLPLFNAAKAIASPNAIVVISEGPKKTTTLERTLGPNSRYVPCSIIGGASSSKRFDWSITQGRNVVILPDNDPHGMKFALEAASRCGGKTVRIVDYDRVGWLDIMRPKDDIEDIIERGATAEQIDDLLGNPRYELDNGFTLNKPYVVTNDGISTIDDSGANVPICGPIKFLGQASDDQGTSWSKHVRVSDYDNRNHDVLIRDADIQTDSNMVIAELSGKGLPIFDHKNLIGILKRLNSKNRSLIVRRPGWIGNDFIVPGHRFSVRNHRRCIFDGYSIDVSRQGDLQGWQQNVAGRAIGNSSLMLGLGIGFGAPLLRLLNHDSVVYHLRGPSSSGKTMSVLMCGSVSGMDIQSWRTTVNALEGICMAHNDMALCIDEIKQSDPQQCSAAAYMIANGKGKGRMNSDSENKQIMEWKTIGFSTGEISLSEHVMGKTYAGQDVRFVDLQIDGKHGVFDNLHGHADGKTFADTLKQAAVNYRGTPILPYISYLLAADRHDELHQIRKLFMDRVTGNAQAMRVAGHFAILAIGIEMAIKAKVLPWKSGIGIDAILSIFNGWKDNHAESGEYRRALLALRDLISTQTLSFVEKTNLPIHSPVTLLGFRFKNALGSVTYAISASAWSTKLSSEVKNQAVRMQMAKDNILTQIGSEQHRCPITGANGRYYEVNADALDAVLHR